MRSTRRVSMRFPAPAAAYRRSLPGKVSRSSRRRCPSIFCRDDNKHMSAKKFSAKTDLPATLSTVLTTSASRWQSLGVVLLRARRFRNLCELSASATSAHAMNKYNLGKFLCGGRVCMRSLSSKAGPLTTGQSAKTMSIMAGRAADPRGLPDAAMHRGACWDLTSSQNAGRSTWRRGAVSQNSVKV